MIKVRNKTVMSIARKFARARYELNKSGSANHQTFEAADIARQLSYLDDVVGYLNYAQNRKPLDQPKARPQEFEIPDPISYALVENEAVNDLNQMLFDMEIEISHCPSNARAGGLSPFDEKRLLTAVDDAKDFIMNYAAKLTPLDFPESSPSREKVGQGKSGVGLTGSTN